MSERVEPVLAAVLVPLFRDPEGELRLVLTKRRADLRRHAGEISFPGGRRDANDADLTETALREAEEEIGLPRGEARVIAALTPTSTFATNYTIHPFVAVLAHDPRPRRWRASEHEVETVLEPLLGSLASARGRTMISRRGFTFETDAYLFDDQVVWGATARIFDDLLAHAPELFGDYSGPLATGTPTRLPHSVQEPS
ncbi:MAG: NUDIX hydrolase [Solirubrobacteraceae bacterium]